MSDSGSQKELEVVYVTNDPVKVLIAKTLLESAGITYFVKGDHTADLFGWGSFSSFQAIQNEVEILVPKDEVDDCREILQELDR